MAGLCAFVCALTMWGATTDFLTALQLADVREELGKAVGKDYMEALRLQLGRAQLAAWSDMRKVRIIVALVLSVTAGLSFAAALRILLPMGLRREGMRALLTRALLWTAGARVIAGAADTGAARYAAESLKKGRGAVPGREQWLEAVPAHARQSYEDGLNWSLDHLPAMLVATSATYTLIVTALIVMLWRYFCRDEVKQTLMAADDTPPASRL